MDADVQDMEIEEEDEMEVEDEEEEEPVTVPDSLEDSEVSGGVAADVCTCTLGFLSIMTVPWAHTTHLASFVRSNQAVGLVTKVLMSSASFLVPTQLRCIP